MDVWDEPETDIEWIRPSFWARARLFLKRLSMKLAKVFFLSYILVVFIFIVNGPNENYIEKDMRSALQIELDTYQIIKAK